ncbi:hypothetical protein AMTRI_Chr02g255240 [Amborella trichopoda]
MAQAMGSSKSFLLAMLVVLSLLSGFGARRLLDTPPSAALTLPLVPPVPSTISAIPTTIPSIPTTIPSIPTNIPPLPSFPSLPTTIPNFPTSLTPLPSLPLLPVTIPTTIPSIPNLQIPSIPIVSPPPPKP